MHECKWNLWCHHEIFEALHSHGSITQWTHTSTHIHTLIQQQANFTWPDTEIVAGQSVMHDAQNKTKKNQHPFIRSHYKTCGSSEPRERRIQVALNLRATSRARSPASHHLCEHLDLFALGVDCNWRRSSFYCSLRDSEGWKMEPGLEPRDDRGKRTPERNSREVKCTKLWVFYFPQRKGDICLRTLRTKYIK